MNAPVRTFPWTIVIGLLLLLLTLAMVLLLAGYNAKLANQKPLPVLGQVADFTLTNQSGQTVSLADLRGTVWVADIIFTRCPGPCYRMTRQMKEVQDALPAGSSAKLVSLTTDPDHDTPAVLKAYEQTHKADPRRWMFLTGTKSEIAKLAIDGLKLTAVEVDPAKRTSENDLWIHSTIFVVVDKQGRLRGIYHTEDGSEWPSFKQALLSAVTQLEREP